MRKFIITVSVLSLTCLMTAAGMAQGIGFNGIGGKIGFAKPENIDGTLNFGAHANLGEIIENLVLYPSVDFWTKSEGALDFSQFAINADARYYFPSGGNLSFFGGGGLGLFFNSADVSFLGQTASNTSTDLGLNLFGGFDLPVGDALSFTAEGRFVVSDGNVFKVTGGLTYAMGQ